MRLYDVDVYRPDRAGKYIVNGVVVTKVKVTTILASDATQAKKTAIGTTLVELRRKNGRRKLGPVPLIADAAEVRTKRGPVR